MELDATLHAVLKTPRNHDPVTQSTGLVVSHFKEELFCGY